MSKKSIYLFSIVLVLGLVSNANAQVATNPAPADGALHASSWAALSWSPGATATSHNVYFGENSADVAAGTGSTFLGNQTASNLIVGMPGFPYPDPLVPDTTYYWRIDEVEADGTTIHKGDVWSFSLPPRTAYNPDPPDGAIHVDADVTLSWTAGMGAKLHHVYLGDKAADVEAGTGGTYKGPVATATYTPSILANDRTYYWRIDEFDGLATHKGDLWRFRTMPQIILTDPNLVGWWRLDRGHGTTALDWSGHENHGTLKGNPQWVADGYDGGALNFGSGGYVAIQNLYYASTGLREVSVCAWVRTNSSGTQYIASFDRDNYWRLEINGSGGGPGQVGWDVWTDDGQNDYGSVRRVDNGEWHHVCGVFDNGTSTIYVDGTPDPSSSLGRTFGNGNTRYGFIGANSEATSFDGGRGGGSPVSGEIDDLRIYDKALTQEEIVNAMRGDTRLAWGPSPAAGSIPDMDDTKPLSWSPGDNAAQHDVYFGTNPDAVDNADTSDTTGIYRGRQNFASYTPPEALEYNLTYYWRIDEYNTDGTVSKGSVWAFTIADFILVDDFESYNDLDPMDPNSNRIFLKWLDGYLQPTNGSIVGYEVPPFAETGTVYDGGQAMPYFYNNSVGNSEATMTLSYPRDWTKHSVEALSLWFVGYPVSVGSFTEEPAGVYALAVRSVGNISGTSDEFHFAYQQLNGAGSIIAKAEWVRDADDNAQAGVMIRDTLDPDSAHAAVLLETNDIVANTEVSFDRRATKTGGTTSTTVAGIRAPQWLKIERDAAGNITGSYSADGVTWTNLGGELITMSAPAYIGLAVASENAGVTCEAQFSNVQITGAGGQWANQDIGILVNAPEPMYVAVANSGGTPAVVYYEDPEEPNATQIDTWTQWNIDLKEFSDQGVNLANVDSISIGFGDKANPQPGGSGKMYFDDIRLYRPRCMLELLPKPAADLDSDCVVDYLDLEIMTGDWLESDSIVVNVTPDPAGLMLHYKFDGNADDSSGNNYHGIEMDGPTYVDGKFGQAIHLDGIDDYVAIQDMSYVGTGHPEVTACAWIRTTESGDGIIASFDRSEFWRLEINGAGGGPGQVGWDVWSVTANTYMDYGSTTRVDDGQWHHVAGVFDNGTMIIYIDGSAEEPFFSADSTFGRARAYPRYGFVGSNSEASYPPPTGRPDGGYFEGDVDELYVYHRALSLAEIRYLADDTPGDGEFYVPVPSVANLYNEEPPLARSVNFKDFVLLADGWLDEQLWPEP